MSNKNLDVSKVKDSYKAGVDALNSYIDIFENLAKAQEKLSSIEPHMIDKTVGEHIMAAFDSTQRLVAKFGKQTFGQAPGLGVEDDVVEEPIEEPVEEPVELAKDEDGNEYDVYGEEEPVDGDFDEDLEPVEVGDEGI